MDSLNDKLLTERLNPKSVSIDDLSTSEIVRIINAEDAKVAGAVNRELLNIEKSVDLIVGRLQKGGRLFYFGAETSGRIGLLDASELPPTYGISDDMVQAFLAGGFQAFWQAAEAIEDDFEDGRALASAQALTAKDVVVAITASGRTPWVRGATTYAKECGASVISITCNPGSPLALEADIPITPVVGPEVVAGSTRMKAGTAQKMVLNTISTAVMIRLGKVYRNLMVDMRPSNEKLKRRAEHILQEAASVDADGAHAALKASNYEIKTALVMLLSDVDASTARQRLQRAAGFVRVAVGQEYGNS